MRDGSRTNHQAFKEAVDEYYARGYDVMVEERLPEPFDRFVADIVARCNGRIIVVELLPIQPCKESDDRIRILSEIERSDPKIHFVFRKYDAGAAMNVPDRIEIERLVRAADDILTSSVEGAYMVALLAVEATMYRMFCIRNLVEVEHLDPSGRIRPAANYSLMQDSILDSQYHRLEKLAFERERLISDPGSCRVDRADVQWMMDLASAAVSDTYATFDEMVDWFLENYQSPESAGLPFDVRDNDFMWFGRGPHDPGEVLRERFVGCMEEDIEAAVRMADKHCTKWAKIDSDAAHPRRAERFDSLESESSMEVAVGAARSEPGVGGLRIDRRHIELWLQRADARHELPRLVRRLIHETTPGLIGLDMPAGTGVDAPGWDGTVRSLQATAWVPEGLSQWEMSASSAPRRKALQDYDKRDTTADGSETNSAVYVGFYPHREWSLSARRDWGLRCTADRKWREVRAYGLDDIEDWLEQAPVTRAWFAEEIGLPVAGYRTAQNWWSRWVSHTSPALPVGIALAGRDEAAADLRARLSGDPSVITVRADSADEVGAFVFAAIRGSGGSCETWLARSAFVEDASALRALLAWPSPLVLLVKKPDLVKDLPFSPGHHVIVPTAGADAHIELPRIDSTRAMRVLEASGMATELAEEVGYLARRSLAAARIRLAREPELVRPSWAAPPTSRTVRAVLLAGSWMDQHEGDRSILEALAGEEYQTVRETLAELRHHECPLVMHVDRSWHLVSSEDAWELLSPSITDDDVERFGSAVREVLGERAASLDPAAAHDWLSALAGGARDYSQDIRKGLARSLALLAVHGDRLDPSVESGAASAAKLVRDVLSPPGSSTGVDGWHSLANVLSVLAEAAPDVFLEALDTALRDAGGAFLPSVGSLQGRIAHALEGIAWSEDHFAQCAYAVAYLWESSQAAASDDSLIRSLLRMFAPLLPAFSVPLSARLEILDGLRSRHPACAWQLTLGLSQAGPLIMEPRRPKYRSWATEHPALPPSDLADFLGEMVSRLADDARSDPSRLAEVTEELDRLPTQAHELLIDALDETLARHALVDAERARLSEAVQTVLGRARARRRAEAGLSGVCLDRLNTMSSQMESPDNVERHRWLFEDWHPRLHGSSLEASQDSQQARDERIAHARRDAVRDIHLSSGLAGVLRLASEPTVRDRDCRHFVSSALADALGEEFDPELLEMLADSRPQLERDMAFDYFARRFRVEGWDWLDRLLERPGLTAYQMARLLGSTGDYPRAWQTAEKLSGFVADIFWKHFVPLGLGHEFPHVEYAAQHLLDAGRPRAALTLLETHADDSGSGGCEGAALLTARTLEELSGTSDEPAAGPLEEYGLARLFGLLDRHRASVGDDTIASLEWRYLPALGFEVRATGLHRRMADDPHFFVDLVCTVYRRQNRGHDDVSTEPLDADTRQRVLNAHRLLTSWDRPPGQGDDGSIDPDRLRAWIAEARQRLREDDRVETGEHCIGEVLYFAPEGSDGIRPGPIVRELLEEFRSEHMEKGLYLAIVNSRGVTSRALDAGGDQERRLAADFRRQADRVKYQWPRTAGILRRVARRYEHEASQEDEEAERVRTGIER